MPGKSWPFSATIFCLLIICPIGFAKVPLDMFFDYGTANGDAMVDYGDDNSSPLINTSIPFPFYNSQRNTIYVNTNGAISLIQAISDYTPNCAAVSDAYQMISPYWADIDTTCTHGTSGVFYRQSTTTRDLTKATNEIRTSVGGQFANVNLTWAFITTWWNTTYYKSCDDYQKRNTFQLIVTTDGRSSFAIFYYNDILWTTGEASGGNCTTGLGGTPAKAGFDAGNGQDLLLIPGSCSEWILNINEESNVNYPGKWIFRVDNDFTNYTFAPSLFPPSTKPTPPPQTGGTDRPSATDRDCACTYRNIWLDVAFLIESSAAMTRQGLGEISGTLAGIVNEMTISQTVNQSSRIGITVYAEQPTVLSTLSSLTDAGQVQSQLLSLSNTYYSDTTRPNLLSGMQTSINQFGLGGSRSWARNVLLIVATSYATGGQIDALQASRQFRENGGFIIVVAYQQPSEADIPDICNLASEGMCYKTGNTSKELFHEVATALCYANCFCKTNDHQFIVNQAFYGTCLHPVAAPTTANTAELICDTEDGRLPQIYTAEKLNFITNISINQLETDQTWVGLKYNTTLNGWFWSSLEGDLVKIDDTELWDKWQPGQPNRTAGDCVQLKRYQGFQLRFQSAPCSSAATAQLKYTCQYNACDTDKFCPDASFPGSG